MAVGGDFRQILPVVEKGSRGQIVESCLKCSDLWEHFHQFRLTQNIRLTEADMNFRESLLKVGDGEVHGIMEVPEDMRSSGNLVDVIYGDACGNLESADFTEMTILTPKMLRSMITFSINCQALKQHFEVKMRQLPRIRAMR